MFFSIDPAGDTDEFPFSCAAGSTLTLKLENLDEEPEAPAELPLLEVTLLGPDDKGRLGQDARAS